MPVPPLIGAPPDSLAGRCARCNIRHGISLDAERGANAMSSWWQELHEQNSVLGRQLRQVGGKMIAVLVAESRTGQTHFLRAISGDLFGNPRVAGCVPPVIQHERFAQLEAETLAELDQLQKHYEQTEDLRERENCVRKRRQASRTLMKAIIDTTKLCNRAGVERPLPDVFAGHGIPSGTADCALPKLLHYANQNGLRPMGIAEAWFGPRLGERKHGTYAAPCAIRCAPILGYLLCDAHD